MALYSSTLKIICNLFAWSLKFYMVHFGSHFISIYDYLQELNINCRHRGFTIHSFIQLADDAVGKNLSLEALMMTLFHYGNWILSPLKPCLLLDRYSRGRDFHLQIKYHLFTLYLSLVTTMVCNHEGLSMESFLLRELQYYRESNSTEIKELEGEEMN